MSPLTDRQLYRALEARDPRFDGVFFVGVTSTRIYCRPVCRAPKPRPDRCRWFATAAAAERRGFRPCLRCRPELAPGPHRWAGARAPSSTDAVAALAREAAARISAGALDGGSVEQLAASLGVTSRHVRRAVERELGATPAELAQTRRLLAAKQLLTETALPVTQVAFASGFGSVRRFNTLFLERYRLAPSRLRRTARAAGRGGTGSGPEADAAGDRITLSLGFRPPYDWPALLVYLGGRATPGVESVTADGGGSYARAVRVGGHAGIVTVCAGRDGRTLRVQLSTSLLPALGELLARLRRLFDLDAEPTAIAAHLGGDRHLAPLVRRRPGLRVPGAVDGFELALRTVLGQQVSVRGATTLAGRLVERFGEPLPPDTARGAALVRLPVTAERLAEATAASVAAIGLPRARAESIVALARAAAGGALPELASATPVRDPAAFARRFGELPGIGPWTTSYVTMRALGWPDAFPEGDLGLRKAMGGISAPRLRDAAERWRPWRSYAAHHLWESLR